MLRFSEHTWRGITELHRGRGRRISRLEQNCFAFADGGASAFRQRAHRRTKPRE